MNIGKTIRQAIDDNGKVIGSHNDNPLLNTLAYDVEFQDRADKRYGYNIIAEKILSQCNPDGFYTNVMEAILDHKHDGSAISKSESYYKTNQGMTGFSVRTILVKIS